MSVQTPIAVIGVGCRFPGADTLEELSALLSSGETAFTPIPDKRWALSAANSGASLKLETVRAGLIGEVDGLDRKCFRISGNEAPMVDPLQRLFLETAWHALENAGLSPATLDGRNIGVYAGVGQSEFALLQAEAGFPGQSNPYQNPGASASVVAGRVAYTLGLTGPVQAIDNACASSLSAVANACDALAAGQCEQALAGGVHVILSKKVMNSLTNMGVLSKSGEHRCYDKSADGFVRGEGCGVVLLKPLEAALADRNQILAVLNGWSQRHNGRTNGMSAPSRAAQATSIRSVLERAGIEPAQVGYFEGHGSGTSLGDVMEAGAIQDALSAPSGQPVSVGSVKAVMGHLEAAAGIAGLMKGIAMVRHGFLPPQAGFSEVNEAVARVAPGVVPPKEGQQWDVTHRHVLAGVLGYNGACVHAALSNGPAAQIEPADGPGLFLISAACPQALQARLVQLEKLLETAPRHVPLSDIARAVSLRWDGMSCRESLYAVSRAEALEQVKQRLAPGAAPSGRARTGLTFHLAGDSTEWDRLLHTLPARLQMGAMAEVLTAVGLPRPVSAGEGISLYTDGHPDMLEAMSLDLSQDPEIALWALVGRLWKRGVSVEASKLWPISASSQDLEIPGYPFQKQVAWGLPLSEKLAQD